MYAATAMQPNIAFAVQHLSQFNSNPGNAHWTAAQCTIRYLYATRDRALILGGPEITLTGWVDSDWGACTDLRCSISGYTFSLGSGLISWSSKKQPIVATSSTEAEYIASCHGVKEAIWLRNLLQLLGFRQTTASCIHCDNVGSNILTWDPSFHARMKHIDIQHHYVITTYENTSKPATFHTHISPPTTILLTALPNLSHARSSRNSLCTWECTMAFQLEGGCWNTIRVLVYK